MEEKEVVITHDTLFEILKREKDRTELQKIDGNFFADVVSYIKDKRKITSGKDSLFSVDDKLNTERQLSNIRRILKDLYDKREKKIINLALDKSRTKSDVMDLSTLLKEEKMFFDKIVASFNKFREGILYNLLSENIPVIEEDKSLEPNIKSGINKEDNQEVNKESNTEIKKEENSKETKLVRFVHAVPKFLGKELEEYGPFEEEDMANLPIEIADTLLLKERVEEIKES